MFRDCARKWAWNKIEGISQPPNRFAERGSAIHSILEAWLEHGTPPDVATEYGAIAAAGLHHLPHPGVAEVEGSFTIELPSADFTGRVDARWIDTDGTPIILDHKTTSGLQWAKTEEDLRTDVQASLYAHVAMRDANKDVAELRWIYYETAKRPRSKRVALRVWKPEVDEQIALIDETAQEMNEILGSKARALDLVPTIGTCGMYGGCAYIQQCNLSTSEKMRGYMTGQSWAEKMLARKGAQINGVAAAAVEAAESAPYINAPEAPARQKAEPEEPLQLFEASIVDAKTKTKTKNFGSKQTAATPPPAEIPTTDQAIGASILDEMDARLETASMQKPKQTRTERLEALLDQTASRCFAASISRGEIFIDESERAGVSYSRAKALLGARPR